MKKRLAVFLIVFISLSLFSQGLEIPEVVVYGEREVEVKPPEKPDLPFVKSPLKVGIGLPEAEIKEDKLKEIFSPPNYGYYAGAGAGSVFSFEGAFFSQGRFIPELLKGIYTSNWKSTEGNAEVEYFISPFPYFSINIEYTPYNSSGKWKNLFRPGLFFTAGEIEVLGWMLFTSREDFKPFVNINMHPGIGELNFSLYGSSFTGEAVWNIKGIQVGLGLIETTPLPVLRASFKNGIYINTSVKKGLNDSFYINEGYSLLLTKNTYTIEAGLNFLGIGFIYIPEDTIKGVYATFNNIPFTPSIYYTKNKKFMVSLSGEKSYGRFSFYLNGEYRTDGDKKLFSEIHYALKPNLSIFSRLFIREAPFSINGMFGVIYFP